MDLAIQSNGGQLSKAELVSALSYALDLTEGQPEGHGIRCCWIGVNVGQELGLSDGEMSDLYYTLLLKDIGCSSNAARICQLFLTDDIAFKRDIKIVDDSLPQMLRFVLKHTGLKANLAERFRTMVIALAQGEKVGRELRPAVIAVRTSCGKCGFPKPSRPAFSISTSTGTGRGNPEASPVPGFPCSDESLCWLRWSTCSIPALMRISP